MSGVLDFPIKREAGRRHAMGMMQVVAVMRKREAHEVQVSGARGAKSMAPGRRGGDRFAGRLSDIARDRSHWADGQRTGIGARLSRGPSSAPDEVKDGGQEKQADDQKGHKQYHHGNIPSRALIEIRGGPWA